MNASLVLSPATSVKFALATRAAAKRTDKRLKVKITHVHNHSSKDLDLRRLLTPQARAFIVRLIEKEGITDNTGLKTRVDEEWPKLAAGAGGGVAGVAPSLEALGRVMGQYYEERYGPRSMAECHEKAQAVVSECVRLTDFCVCVFFCLFVFFSDARQPTTKKKKELTRATYPPPTHSLPCRVNAALAEMGGKVVYKCPANLFAGTGERHARAAAESGSPDLLQGWAFAIRLPISNRAHQWLQQAGETIYIDTTANVANDPEVKLVWVLARTPIGAIPLAIIITNVNSAAGIAAALEAVKEALPANKAFYFRTAEQGGRGLEVGGLTTIKRRTDQASTYIDQTHTHTTTPPHTYTPTGPANAVADMMM